MMNSNSQNTRIGIFPKVWDICDLKDICKKIGDGLHSTPIYRKATNFYFVNGNNFLNGSIFINKNTKTVSESEYKKHFIDIDDSTILMSINGTIGNLALYSGQKIILGKSACYMNVSHNL